MNRPHDLHATLDEIVAWLKRYTVLPHSYDAVTLALWSAHTWVSTAFYTTPRLVISSPVPGSGKTRVLELLALISYAPRLTFSATPAALYRRIAKATDAGETPPTILFDETDAIFHGRPGPGAEDLRALLNAGYKRGASVDRCEGDASHMEIREFPVFAPVALAGLAGHMPDTITTRAVVIEMRKRAHHEKVAPYYERRASAEIANAVSFLESWGPEAVQELIEVDPALPPGVEDRPAEVWQPLLAVADMAGGHWPDTAREACLAAINRPTMKPLPRGIELLSDIRDVMGRGALNDYPSCDKIATTDLLPRLRGLEDSQWRELGARALASILAGYSVAPIAIRFPTGVVKGYTTAPTSQQVGLTDAWNRYLPDSSPGQVPPIRR